MPHHDRRFAVIANPIERHSRGADYYAELYAALNDPLLVDGVAWELSRLDISGFNQGAHPAMNAAKRAVIDAAASELERELRRVLSAWDAPIAASVDLMQACGVNLHDSAAVKHFGILMRRLGHASLEGVRPIIDGRRCRLWHLKGRAPVDSIKLVEAVQGYRGTAWYVGIGGGM